MSGHSKWAGIKHKKAIIDAKKGKAFTFVSNMISVAAREGGGDPSMNFSLRLAIEKARAANMPKNNIDRAIKRGTGELKGSTFEEFTYEGYGPKGVALLINIATDNRNRAAGEVRSTLTKYGGSLGNNGSVSWMFEKKGQIQLTIKNQQLSKGDLELAIIDSGADDFEENEGKLFIYTKPEELMKVKENLETMQILIEEADLLNIPKTEVKITDQDTANKIIKLVDTLEELDDVIDVTVNADLEITE